MGGVRLSPAQMLPEISPQKGPGLDSEAAASLPMLSAATCCFCLATVTGGCLWHCEPVKLRKAAPCPLDEGSAPQYLVTRQRSRACLCCTLGLATARQGHRPHSDDASHLHKVRATELRRPAAGFSPGHLRAVAARPQGLASTAGSGCVPAPGGLSRGPGLLPHGCCRGHRTAPCGVAGHSQVREAENPSCALTPDRNCRQHPGQGHRSPEGASRGKHLCKRQGRDHHSGLPAPPSLSGAPQSEHRVTGDPNVALPAAPAAPA